MKSIEVTAKGARVYSVSHNKVKDYVISILPKEDYEGQELTTLEDKAMFTASRISSEYMYLGNVKTGLRDLVKGWLMGLSLDAAFYYDDIENLLKEWEKGKSVTFEQLGEEEQGRALNRYWDIVSSMLLKLIHDNQNKYDLIKEYRKLVITKYVGV